MPYKHKPLPPLKAVLDYVVYDPDTGAFTYIKTGKTYVRSLTGAYMSIRIPEYGTYSAHRLAWYIVTGNDPGVYEIDHIDRTRDNNKFSNLRLATRSENACNTAMHSNNTSGVRNIHYCKHSKAWKLCITRNGRTVFQRKSKDKQVVIDALLAFQEG
jgi:hypothetical protein